MSPLSGQPNECWTSPGLNCSGGHLPQLLQADAVFLRLAPVAQAKARLDLLGQRSARALGDQHIAAVQLHARLIVRLGPAVLGHAEHPGDHPAQGAGLSVEGFRRREAGIDLHPQRLGLLSQPAAQVGQRADPAAVVGHEARLGQQRQVQLAVGAEQQVAVVRDRRIQRRALRLPVRNQLVQADGIDHRARQDMGARPRTPFPAPRPRDLRPGGGRQLLQPDRRAQARGARADDDDVIVHGLPGGDFLRVGHDHLSPRH